MQEQQKKEFAHMMNALTKSVEVEIEDEASSAASEHELDADYEAEEEWAKNELKKSEGDKKGEEGKDETPGTFSREVADMNCIGERRSAGRLSLTWSLLRLLGELWS